MPECVTEGRDVDSHVGAFAAYIGRSEKYLRQDIIQNKEISKLLHVNAVELPECRMS